MSGQKKMARGRSVLYKAVYAFVVAAFLAVSIGAFTPAARAQVADPAGATARLNMLTYIRHNFREMSEWFKGQLFATGLVPAMQRMTDQMVGTGTQYVYSTGTFFDAKEQLEAQRDLQRLQAAAYKDYQPSREFCAFGTAARSLAATQMQKPLNRLAMVQRSMGRHLGSSSSAGSGGEEQDKLARWTQFKSEYCDPLDNNWQGTGTGLAAICGAGASSHERVNRDIDFTRFLEEPRTLEGVNFADTKNTAAEEDLLAMAANLYGHQVNLPNPAQAGDAFQGWRATQAMRNVAENSFQHLVAMKAEGSAGAPTNVAYLGALVAALGVPPREILTMIGERPSYYAQLELLAKKIAQNPSFFSGLYDKPANVERTAAALRAIELMIDRAIYESRLRQEMLASVLLAAKLRPEFDAVKGDAGG